MNIDFSTPQTIIGSLIGLVLILLAFIGQRALAKIDGMAAVQGQMLEVIAAIQVQIKNLADNGARNADEIRNLNNRRRK